MKDKLFEGAIVVPQENATDLTKGKEYIVEYDYDGPYIVDDIGEESTLMLNDNFTCIVQGKWNWVGNQDDFNTDRVDSPFIRYMRSSMTFNSGMNMEPVPTKDVTWFDCPNNIVAYQEVYHVPPRKIEIGMKAFIELVGENTLLEAEYNECGEVVKVTWEI